MRKLICYKTILCVNVKCTETSNVLVQAPQDQPASEAEEETSNKHSED